MASKGILRYRGIPIEQLAEHSRRFIETAYLLIYGHLPEPRRARRASRTLLTRHSLIHEDMKHFFDGFPSTAHPMAMLSAMVASLVELLSRRARRQRPTSSATSPSRA